MISVVIPLYNKEHCVLRTINSVLEQTCPDFEFEIIVVNDGSTDAGAELLKETYGARIKVITTENHGVSSARNTGIIASSGDYVAFLDADDEWLPSYLEELRTLIHSFPDAKIWGFSNLVVKEETESADYHGIKPGFRGLLDDVWHHGVPYWTSAVCISRDALEKVGMFDERMAYGEDLDLWWRVLFNYRGAYCAKPLVMYHQDAENRAMAKFIPFENHLPYYIEKYSEYRASNKDFRFFVDRECLYRLFQYTGIKKYRRDLHRVLSQIDFSQQKLSMRLRFRFPSIYRIHMKRQGRL